MRFFPKWFNRVETKASKAGAVISQYLVGNPVWTPRNYEKLAREAYIINVTSHRCTKLIASNAASVKWVLKDKSGEIIKTHPLLELLKRPNPMNGKASLFEGFYSFHMLSGNGYLEAVGPKGKPPRELWTKRPDRMQVVPGNKGMPQRFEFSKGGGAKVRWDVDPITGKSEILHVRDFHPLNDWYGLSRVEPGAQDIDISNAYAGHNKALLDNGARPSGALIFKPIKNGDTVQNAPEEVILAAKEDLENHTGPLNAGKPFILGGDVDWLEMGLNPKDMDFHEGSKAAERKICLAWGVPHILIVDGQSTFNNVSEAKLELWESTIIPYLDNMVSELNNWLVPMFGDGLELEYDMDAISALEPRREAKRKSTIEQHKEGIITNAEARERLQYGPISDNAVKKVDASVLKVLLDAIPTIGFKPLLRYNKSVGLFEEGMSEEDLADAVTLLISDEDENDDDTTNEDEQDEQDV